MPQKEQLGNLSEKELKLIEILRNTIYGEVRIGVQHGQPMIVEEVQKSIKL